MASYYCMTVLYVLNLFTRRGSGGITPVSVQTGEIVLSGISVLLLSFSGYLGGLLAYQYGIGQNRHPRGESVEEPRRAA